MDYIFYSAGLAEYILNIETLETVHTDVSDHIPVLCKLNISFERSGRNESDVNMKPSSRIKWNIVNKERYIRLLDESLRSLDINVATVSTLANAVIKLNRIISECAKEAAPKGVERLRRAKLRSWTPQVQGAVKANDAS